MQKYNSQYSNCNCETLKEQYVPVSYYDDYHVINAKVEDFEVVDLFKNDCKSKLKTSVLREVCGYRDVSFCAVSTQLESFLMKVIAFHSVNHILDSRREIARNTNKLKNDLIECRDQGFTRPTVLILLPFRNDAFMLINEIIAISKLDVNNRDRFNDQFGSDDTPNPRKSDDFNHCFKGNIDDNFKIGLKFSKKGLTLYSEFYSSDIIIASPLGLQMIIGEPGDKNRDFDYLSSIEIVVLDKADYFLMQNWAHVWSVFNHLNLIPTVDHNCDFSRIRNYCLDGNSKLVRQNIVFSHYEAPELNSLFNNYSHNKSGKVTVGREYDRGSISAVQSSCSQIFHRLPNCSHPSMVPDARFNVRYY